MTNFQGSPCRISFFSLPDHCQEVTGLLDQPKRQTFIKGKLVLSPILSGSKSSQISGNKIRSRVEIEVEVEVKVEVEAERGD